MFSLMVLSFFACSNGTEGHKSSSTTKVAAADIGDRSCTPPKGVVLTPGRPNGQIAWSPDKSGTDNVVICDGTVARWIRVTGLIGSSALEDPNVELSLATVSLKPVEVLDVGISIQCISKGVLNCDPIPPTAPAAAVVTDTAPAAAAPPAPKPAPKVIPSAPKPPTPEVTVPAEIVN